MFRKGVGIFYYSGAIMKDRVYKSNGTEIVGGSYKGYSYDQNARKASKPWKLLSKQESKSLFLHASDSNFRDHIGLMRVPDKVQSLFVKLGLNKVKSYEELESLKKRQPLEYMEAIEALDESFADYLITDDNLDKLGIHIGPSDVETATISSRGKYVGLHVDYWDELPLSHIQHATNRISINLGKEDRYLLFINLTLKHIYEILHNEGKKQFHQYYYADLIHSFFATYSNYPVIKLRIKPYEAYIAPTENIIHDGSTEGSKAADITLTTRGYFKIGQNH